MASVQDGKGKASAAGGGGSGSSSSVDPSSLLGLLDKLKMAALYFQKCGGKAQSTVTAEEEAGFLQVKPEGKGVRPREPARVVEI